MERKLSQPFSIYDRNERYFDGYGISVISKAIDPLVKQVVNEEYSFSFSIAKGNPAFSFLQTGRFIKAYGAVYIIRRIEEFSSYPEVSVFVFCEHVIFELLDEFIPDFAHRNSTVQYMLNQLFLKHPRFKAYSSILGGYNSQVTQGTRLKNLNNICENSSGIWKVTPTPDEDGYFRIEVIPDEGEEVGTLVHNRKNLNSVKRTTDGSEVVTRLYVYGQENIGIESVNNNLPYIDSPRINDYPKPVEGSIKYETQPDPATLKLYGQRYLKTVENDKISYEIKMNAIKEAVNQEVEIGDVLTVIDELLDINVKVKVVALEWYPEENQSNVTLNEVIPDAAKLIAGLVDTSETETGTLRGNVWTEWLNVGFTNEVITVYFTNRYRTEPTINVQVYGANNPNIIVNTISQVDGTIEYITGCTIHVPSGTGTTIAMQSIGRI